MPDDQRTIPISKGRPHLVAKRSAASPPPPLVDRRFGERRKPLPPVPFDKIVWPFAVGLCLGFLAPEALKLAYSLGYVVVRFFFPFSLLAARPEFGFGPSAAEILSTIALYLQFPLEGALATLNLRRHTPLRPTMIRLALVHLAGAALLILLERPHPR
jgi:hypothetical protein